MRLFLGLLVGIFLAGTAMAGPGEPPVNASMKELFEEMKSHAVAEKEFREQKKKEILALEAKIDGLRTEAKAIGATKDPDSVKPLQVQRLSILEEVARRDVQTAEQSVKFSERKLGLAKENLSAFEQKKAEAEKALGS